jgi:hypothetical protein
MTQPNDTIAFQDSRTMVGPCMFKIGDHARIRLEGLLFFITIKCTVFGIIDLGLGRYRLRLTDGKRVYDRYETDVMLVFISPEE